jgi:hypothetical protein
MSTQEHAIPRPYPAGRPGTERARRPSRPSAAGGRALASARLDARRRRIRRIRTTAIAIAIGLFLALWAVIFTQLVTGHDPALAASSARTATTSAATASTSGTAQTSSGSTASGSGSTGSASGSTAGATSPVTTSQS